MLHSKPTQDDIINSFIDKTSPHHLTTHSTGPKLTTDPHHTPLPPTHHSRDPKLTIPPHYTRDPKLTTPPHPLTTLVPSNSPHQYFNITNQSLAALRTTGASQLTPGPHHCHHHHLTIVITTTTTSPLSAPPPHHNTSLITTTL